MIKQFSVVEAAAANFPLGKFVAVSDAAKGYSFAEDGSFGYYFGGINPVVSGTYTVVGNLLSIINPNETDPKCQGAVTYQWSYEAGKLTFTPIGEDTCRARKDSFGDTYIKSES
jgi:hypothetical protein